MTVSESIRPSGPDPERDFLALPEGVGPRCERAWRAFVSDPPASRRLAEEALAGEGDAQSRAYAAICLAYHEARTGDAAAAASHLGLARGLCEKAGDARAARLAAIVGAYVDVARGDPERAVANLEAALADSARSSPAFALDRFLACHALALAHGRLGHLDQVLHHHYANLLLLEQHGAATPLAVVLLNLSSTLTAIDDWEEALELARRAVECCGRMSNAALRRRAEINVALALRFLGRIDESLALLQGLRAEAYRDPGSDFALYINSAEALAQGGHMREASECLARARESRSAAGDPHERTNLAWVEGLIAARAGSVDEARRKLEQAKEEAAALRKVHVPLLPRIVQQLAQCHAMAGDHARAFETFQQFHDEYEARLGYTTRARYSSRQSREGAAAVAAVLASESAEPAAPGVDRARLNEALRRTLSAAGSAGESLAGWGAPAIERIGSEARGLGVAPSRIGGLIRELESSPAAAAHAGDLQVHVRVLGDFEVAIARAPLRFGRKRPERPLALLKLLAVHGPRGETEARIADALWPDLDGDAALRSLAVSLHRLRNLLGGNDRIAHKGRRLALATRVVWCDSLAFEELLDRAAAARSADERERLTAEALALYRGDLVVDEDRERWAIAARERLRQRFLLACARQGARLAAARRWEEAVASYGRGLEVDPCAEELCLGVMRGTVALGRPEEGIAAYRRRAAACGAGPAPAVEALYREIADRTQGPGRESVSNR